MAAPDGLPDSDTDRLLRQVGRHVGSTLDDRDLGALGRMLHALEADGSTATLSSVGAELGRLSQQFWLSGDRWMAGYLAACYARVSAERDRRRLEEAGFDQVVERTQEEIDGLVFVALTDTGELTLGELAEAVAFDVPAVAASVARWQRRGHVATETASDGTMVVRFQAN